MTNQADANTSFEILPELFVRQTGRILRLMYVQALFLAVTYVMGVWLATEMASHIAVTQPEVVVHVVLASTLASITVALGFLAVLQHQKDVAALNFLLFLTTILAGVAGFLLLGNTTSSFQVTVTNLTMVTGMGVGIPVTGYSMAKEARIVRSNGVRGAEPSVAVSMAFIALLALALTVIAGVSTRAVALSSSLSSDYPTAVALHFGLAAVTMSLVLGVLVLSVMEGSAPGPQPRSLVRQRALFAILGLASVCLAGGAGVIAAGLVPGNSGGLSYLVMMGESAAAVYGFLVLVITAPFGGAASSSAGPEAGRALEKGGGLP